MLLGGPISFAVQRDGCRIIADASGFYHVCEQTLETHVLLGCMPLDAFIRNPTIGANHTFPSNLFQPFLQLSGHSYGI